MFSPYVDLTLRAHRALSERLKLGFEPAVAVLPVSALLPLKTVPDAIKQTPTYKQIAQSVSEIGIIEPLARESIMAMRERKRDQLTTASAISAWRAASSPITTVQTKHLGGQVRRIPPVPPGEANKMRM
jgi:hypothetical protein